MKVKAVVKELTDNGYAVIESQRKSACADCHKESCGVCDLFLGDDRIRAIAKNDIGAAVGDTVIAESSEKHIILGALTIFILPLICGFAGYSLGAFILEHSERLCALYALCGVFLCFALLFIITKLKKGVGQNIYLTEIVDSNEKKM